MPVFTSRFADSRLWLSLSLSPSFSGAHLLNARKSAGSVAQKAELKKLALLKIWRQEILPRWNSVCRGKRVHQLIWSGIPTPVRGRVRFLCEWTTCCCPYWQREYLPSISFEELLIDECLCVDWLEKIVWEPLLSEATGGTLSMLCGAFTFVCYCCRAYIHSLCFPKSKSSSLPAQFTLLHPILHSP